MAVIYHGGPSISYARVHSASDVTGSPWAGGTVMVVVG